MNCQLKTLYEILEINQNSSIDEIKRGYRKQAIKWHPDKNINNKQIAEERFKEISLAYEILIDSDKKKDYDKMNFVRQKDLYDLIKAHESFMEKKTQYENRSSNIKSHKKFLKSQTAQTDRIKIKYLKSFRRNQAFMNIIKHLDLDVFTRHFIDYMKKNCKNNKKQ